MQLPIARSSRLLGGLALTAILAACAVREAAPPPVAVQTPPACTPAAEGDALVGNWLGVRKEKGVAGELRTLFTLQQDGTVAYSEQLKRRDEPSQGLSETGCWHREGNTMVMRTLTSNGEPVNLEDPIYTNRYAVGDVAQDKMDVTMPDGSTLRLKRMSPGYRLPF